MNSFISKKNGEKTGFVTDPRWKKTGSGFQGLYKKTAESCQFLPNKVHILLWSFDIKKLLLYYHFGK